MGCLHVYIAYVDGYPTKSYNPLPVLLPTILHLHDLYRDPNDAYDHIQSLVLSSLVLKAPHAIRLFVPVRAGCTVHSSSSYMRLSIRISSIGYRIARGDLRVIFTFGSGFVLHPIQGGCGNEMLDDSAVDSVLE